jgi:hypothetical protein
MKIFIYRFMQIFFALLLGYSIVTGIYSFIFHGYIDFPCAINYDETHKCISTHRDQKNSQIQSFLSVYYAGYSGGGCDYNHTGSNFLNLQTPATDLQLVREKNNLFVNGRIFRTGKEFQTVNIFDWNPWIISRMQFVNLGTVAECDSPADLQSITIVGEYRTETSLVKGICELLVSLTGFIYFSKRLKVITKR